MGAAGPELRLLQRGRQPRRTRSGCGRLDLSWGQVQPDPGGPLDRTDTGVRAGHVLRVPRRPARRARPVLDAAVRQRRGLGAAVGGRDLRRKHVRPGLRRREAPADLGRLRLERPARHLPAAVRGHRARRRPPAAVRLRAGRVHLGRVRLRDHQRPPSTRATSTPRRTSPGTRTHGPTWRRSSGRTPTSSSSPARTTRGARSARTTTCWPPRPSTPESGSGTASPRSSTST